MYIYICIYMVGRWVKPSIYIYIYIYIYIHILYIYFKGSEQSPESIILQFSFLLIKTLILFLFLGLK